MNVGDIDAVKAAKRTLEAAWFSLLSVIHDDLENSGQIRLIVRAEQREDRERFFAGVRLLLDAAGGVLAPFHVNAAEAETLAAALVTIRTACLMLVAPFTNDVGGQARVEVTAALLEDDHRQRGGILDPESKR